LISLCFLGNQTIRSRTCVSRSTCLKCFNAPKIVGRKRSNCICTQKELHKIISNHTKGRRAGIHSFLHWLYFVHYLSYRFYTIYLMLFRMVGTTEGCTFVFRGTSKRDAWPLHHCQCRKLDLSKRSIAAVDVPLVRGSGSWMASTGAGPHLA
jgi:hypothetical protein